VKSLSINGRTEQGGYPTTIKGFRFLERRELPPVTSCSDFAVTEQFTIDSANTLLCELPEDYQLTYFDPEAKTEEAWIQIRRLANKYFMSKLQRGINHKYQEVSFNSVLASFMSCPFVQNLPPYKADSFTISRIPDHQHNWHLKNNIN
jgi:hypothetical protein